MKLFSRVLGSENDVDLIILHGLLGSADNWQTLGKRYAEEFRVHLVDARNHGRSPNDENHGYDLMAEDLLQYLDDNSIDKAVLLGHSMGGKTVMHFAEKHPERVSKLIVADIAPSAYKAHHGPIFEALLSTNPENASSRESVEGIIRKRLGDEKVLVPFLMKGLFRVKEGGYSWRFNVPVLFETLESVTENIEVSMNTLPALFIRGLNSSYVSDEDIEGLEDVYMQLQTVDIEDAGHWLHAEKPEEFFEATSDFLIG